MAKPLQNDPAWKPLPARMPDFVSRRRSWLDWLGTLLVVVGALFIFPPMMWLFGWFADRVFGPWLAYWMKL